jgi:predicted nuclease with RNAse H fold
VGQAVVRIVGVDLSGPTNTGDTAAAWFDATSTGLSPLGLRIGLGDRDLLDLLASLGPPGALVVGLDAPLSYQPGGGDRPADRALRRLLVERGLAPGSVMAPTMTRMAYLTLRGVSVARAVERLLPGTRIVEVHPGAAMALRGAPVADVRRFKTDAAARRRLADWLGTQGVGKPSVAPGTDHELAACACALAAWQWSLGRPAWRAEADGPLHPYDFAC